MQIRWKIKLFVYKWKKIFGFVSSASAILQIGSFPNVVKQNQSDETKQPIMLKKKSLKRNYSASETIICKQ